MLPKKKKKILNKNTPEYKTAGTNFKTIVNLYSYEKSDLIFA